MNVSSINIRKNVCSYYLYLWPDLIISTELGFFLHSKFSFVIKHKLSLHVA